MSGYTDKVNDVTKDVLKNLEHIGVDALIPIGGDDTLSYGKRLHDEGVNVVAIPKTMDNDVYGTDYCIGFSTCVTRTIEATHSLRTSAGSHERFLVIEVFGRYAGFTALLPSMAGAADRCLIPEYVADVEHLTELMVYDHNRNPSKYSVVLVSEGASLKTQQGMSFESEETDMQISPRVRRERTPRVGSSGTSLHSVDLVDDPPPSVDSEQVEIIGVARSGIVLDDLHRRNVLRHVHRRDAQVAFLFFADASGEHRVPFRLSELRDLTVTTDKEQTGLRPERLRQTGGVVELEAVQITLHHGTDGRIRRIRLSRCCRRRD